MRGVGTANARLGLLGNPSDGYGGRVIAATIADFEAVVTATPSSAWSIEGGWSADSVIELQRAVGKDAGGPTLIAAGLASIVPSTLLRAWPPLSFSFRTTVPREVGLAGSSAIITATLRALHAARDASLPPEAIARAAFDAEVAVLGWAAGPQDRVIQAHGGVLDMDFADGWVPDAWHRVDSARLPPLVLAWDRRTATSSDVVHRDVRARWEAGDAEIVAGMQRFAALAGEGRAALDAGTAAERWPDLLDESYELRRRFWHLSDRDEALVQLAQRHGIGAGLAGSGGAIVGAPREPGTVAAFLDDVAASGAEAIVPAIGMPA